MHLNDGDIVFKRINFFYADGKGQKADVNVCKG